MFVLLTNTNEDVVLRKILSPTHFKALLHGDQGGFGLQILHDTLQSGL